MHFKRNILIRPTCTKSIGTNPAETSPKPFLAKGCGFPFTGLCLPSIRQRIKPVAMALCANRRWLCLLTALLFAVSGAVHACAMTDAAMKMPAMESSMSDQGTMHDHGMDCGGSSKATHADCIAMCATAVGILSELVAVPFVVAMQDIVAAVELPPPSGGPSPDPHPPKR